MAWHASRAHRIKYSTACFSQQPLRRREDAVIDLGSRLGWATTFDADNMFTVSLGFRALDGIFEKDFGGDMYAYVCTTQGASIRFRVHCMRARSNMHFAAENASTAEHKCARTIGALRVCIFYFHAGKMTSIWVSLSSQRTPSSPFFCFAPRAVIDVFTCDKINVCSWTVWKC